MNWVTNDSVIGSVKSRSSQKSGSSQNTGVRLKPPTFDGKNEPKHFFVKLFNYLETYNIEGNEEKIRVLKSCLEGPALDLYLALPQKEQGDIKILERTFQSHFRPAGHNVVETGAFLKIKKGPNQTISEYYTYIRKKANELQIEEAIVEITFTQGLPKDYQRHCLLQKATTLNEYVEKSQEYEKIADIGRFEEKQNMAMAADEIQKPDQDPRLDQLCEILANLKISRSEKNSGQNGQKDEKQSSDNKKEERDSSNKQAKSGPAREETRKLEAEKTR